MARLIQGGIEQGVDAVAHQLVDHAAVAQNDFGGEGEIGVQKLDDLARAHPAGRGAEAFNVGEQCRHLARFTFQSVRRPIFPLDEL